MKRRHSKKKRPVRAIRLWTHEEAEKALPYLRSVVGSVREHWLTVQSHRREADLLQTRPGAGGRDRLLAGEANRDHGRRAEDRFQEALSELSTIDVFLVDPVQGLALIPFRREDELAWFVFDRFDERGLVGWRLHQDGMEQRRPMNEIDEAKLASN